jgi:superfamily II DNA or RNA helicase
MLNDRKTRIVIRVDMLGEGFDLPELKIAALPDVHESLAVTLQFIRMLYPL